MKRIELPVIILSIIFSFALAVAPLDAQEYAPLLTEDVVVVGRVNFDKLDARALQEQFEAMGDAAVDYFGLEGDVAASLRAFFANPRLDSFDLSEVLNLLEPIKEIGVTKLYFIVGYSGVEDDSIDSEPDSLAFAIPKGESSKERLNEFFEQQCCVERDGVFYVFLEGFETEEELQEFATQLFARSADVAQGAFQAGFDAVDAENALVSCVHVPKRGAPWNAMLLGNLGRAISSDLGLSYDSELGPTVLNFSESFAKRSVELAELIRYDAWSVDVDQLEIRLAVEAKSEEDAQRYRHIVEKETLDDLKTVVAELISSLAGPTQLATSFNEEAKAILDAAVKFERDGSTLSWKLNGKFFDDHRDVLTNLQALQKAAELYGERLRTVSNVAHLKYLAIAVHNYHDVTGTLPAAYEANGETWKEAGTLLRFLEDSPGYPGCAMLVDDAGIFQPTPGQKTTNFSEITDGLANTLLFVELVDPKDERACVTVEEFYEELQKCPNDRVGLFVAWADGSVRLLDKWTSLKELKEMASKNGDQQSSSSSTSEPGGVDGGRFDDTKETLVRFAPPRPVQTYVVPDGVKRIAEEAFAKCSSLVNVVLPEGVETIGEDAFSECSSLESVTFPESLKTIARGAFYECSALTNVKLPDALEVIEAATFFGCDSLKNVELPDKLRVVEGSAFYNCPALASVELPDGVKTIESYAFCDCTALRNVVVSKGVEEIEPTAFYGCPASFHVDPDNANYSSESGILFDKNKEKLLHFPAASSIQSYVVPESVKVIAPFAFAGASTLKNIVLPDGLETIGDRAFSGCASLESVELPASVKTIANHVFTGCSALKSVVVSEGIETIGDGAFSGCASLESVELPASVKTIANYAFTGCSTLTKVVLPNGLETIGDEAFADCSSLTSVELPASVKRIPNKLFAGCSALKSVVAPESVETIGRSAFSCCSSLMSFTLPASVKTIESETFFGCSALTSVGLPEGLEEIGSSAFADCSALASLDLPESVKTIGVDAFGNCSSLTNAFVPKGVEEISAGAFGNGVAQIEVDPENANYTSESGVLFDKKKETLLQYPTGAPAQSYAIPESVRVIGAFAFSGSPSLNSVAIPKGVKTIKECAFAGCSALKSVAIANGVETIESFAFDSCVSLASMDVPEGVQTIGTYAFANCSALANVRLPHSVRTIAEGSFMNCSSLKDVVVSEGVVHIGKWAFSDCSSLMSVRLPESVASIGYAVFSECSSLDSIELPKSVKMIENDSFDECRAKLRVYRDSYAETWARENEREFEFVQ